VQNKTASSQSGEERGFRESKKGKERKGTGGGGGPETRILEGKAGWAAIGKTASTNTPKKPKQKNLLMLNSRGGSVETNQAHKNAEAK